MGCDVVGRAQRHDDTIGIDAGLSLRRDQGRPRTHLIKGPARRLHRLRRREPSGKASVPGDGAQTVGGRDQQSGVGSHIGGPGPSMTHREFWLLRAPRLMPPPPHGRAAHRCAPRPPAQRSRAHEHRTFPPRPQCRARRGATPCAVRGFRPRPPCPSRGTESPCGRNIPPTRRHGLTPFAAKERDTSTVRACGLKQDPGSRRQLPNRASVSWGVGQAKRTGATRLRHGSKCLAPGHGGETGSPPAGFGLCGIKRLAAFEENIAPA